MDEVTLDAYVLFDGQPKITRTRQFRGCNKLTAAGYIFFLLCQLTGTLLYAIRGLGCSMKPHKFTVVCESTNISILYPYSEECEVVWSLTRSVHIIGLVFAVQNTIAFPGYAAILRKLKSLPEFFSLLFLLSLTFTRYVILFFVGFKSGDSVRLIIAFAINNVLKLVAVSLFNYTQFNFLKQTHPIFVLVFFKLALAVIFVQEFVEFALSLLQMALHVTDIEHVKQASHDEIVNSHDVLIMFLGLRKFALTAFSFKTMTFFWQKLFTDNRNILCHYDFF